MKDRDLLPNIQPSDAAATITTSLSPCSRPQGLTLPAPYGGTDKTQMRQPRGQREAQGRAGPAPCTPLISSSHCWEDCMPFSQNGKRRLGERK